MDTCGLCNSLAIIEYVTASLKKKMRNGFTVVTECKLIGTTQVAESRQRGSPPPKPLLGIWVDDEAQSARGGSIMTPYNLCGMIVKC